MRSRRILFRTTVVVTIAFLAIMTTVAWLVATSPDRTYAGMTPRDVAVVGGIPLLLLALASAVLSLRRGRT